MKRAALLPLVLVAACGGAPPPAQPPSGLATPPVRPLLAEPAEVAAVAGPSEPPVAPEGLSAVLRVANPQRTWGDATQLLATTPFGLLMMGAAQMGPDLLAEEALGPALAAVVDLEQPVDVAVLDVASESFALSLAIREREVPRLYDRFALKEEGGLLRVVGVRGADPDASRLPMSCALDPGERRGSARVVCAPKREGLVAAPYLVEVMAREPIDVDVRLELLMPALSQAMEEQKDELDVDEDDDEAARVGKELGDGFAREIEGVTVDLRWAGQDVELGLGLRFAGRRTPLTLALVPAPRQDAPPPQAFFRLPRDAGFAFYTQGASRDELGPLRQRLFGLLLEDGVKDGYDRGKLADMLDRVGKVILTGGPFVMGAGIDRAAAEKALSAYEEKKGAAKTRAAARRALEGWTLIGLEEPSAPLIGGLKEIIKLDGELSKTRKKPAAAAAGAGSGASTDDEDDDDKEDTDWVVVRAPAALPAGTLHVELRSRPIKKDGPPAHTDHLYVVPAGQRTWIGVGEDAAVVIDRLKMATDPARQGQTLGGAPGFAGLERPGVLAAGFGSIAGVMGLLTSGDSPEDLDKAARDLGGLALLPARGETPIPWAVSSEVLPSGAARWGFRVRVPGAVIQDVIALVTR